MTRVLYLLFVLSGAAGLIYESIWTRYLGLFVGHDAYAQIIVLVIFLGGMSAGAMVVSRFSERLRDPLRGYALIELAVGLIGLVFHDVYQWSTNFAYGSIYPSLAGSPLLVVAKWSIASALILPQSVLLGATFPLMSAGVLRLRRGHTGQSLSLLYFANSLGAAVGVLVAGFYLVGLAGLPGTLLVAAMLNLVVALVTFGIVGVARRGKQGAESRTPAAADRTPADQGQLATGALGPLLLFTSFGTAVASFIYEIDWIRMLALVLGGATHAFELMLSAFILGLALGSLWIRSRIDRIRNPVRTLGVVQWVMGLMAVATLPIYAASFDWIATLMNTFAPTDLGYVGFTAARYALCLAIMLPATFCAGMTLPLITRTLLRSGSGEAAIGRVYAWNTLGSIVGVALGGMILLPLIGVKAMLVAGAAIDMAIGVLLVWRATDRRMGYGFLAIAPRKLAGGLAAAAVAVSVLVIARVQLEAAAARQRRVSPRHDPEAGRLGDGVLPRRPHGDGVRLPGDRHRPGHAVHQRQARRLAGQGVASELRFGHQAGGPHRRRRHPDADAAHRHGVRAGRAEGCGDRLRLRHDLARAARESEARAGRHRRDRAGDGQRRPDLLPGQPPELRRSPRGAGDRRRQVLLRLRAPEIRPDPVGAVQPVGERRVRALHHRVLRPGAAVPHG